MNKTMLLLKTQIYNYFSLNELFHSEKRRSNFAFITAVGIFTLLALLSGYNVMIALALAKMGQAQLIPAYMVSVSSFIIVVFTVLRSNGILFGSRDYELLSFLPVRAKEIISSKFGFLYLLNFLLGILFMLPAGIIWQIYASAHLLFFFMYLVSAVFVPFVPMCIASLSGLLVTAVSSKFRRKNIVSLVFFICSFRRFAGDRDLQYADGCFWRQFRSYPHGTSQQAVSLIGMVPIYGLLFISWECWVLEFIGFGFLYIC